MSDIKPHAVANVWIQDGDVHASFSHGVRAARFDNVTEWMEDKIWADMCDICNGATNDHFDGCPNDWRKSWDY